MLKELDVKLNHDNMIIQCNNLQTLHLMTAEIDKLSMKLKHIDVQNHWLRQEYKWDHIIIHYIDLKSMIADRLTKALSLNSHHQFLEQMNLIDIQDRLQDRRAQEAAAFEPPEPMDIDWILRLDHQHLYEKFWVWMGFYS